MTRRVPVRFAVFVATAVALLLQGSSMTAHATSATVRHDQLVVRVYSYGGITWGRVEVYYDRGGALVPFHTCTHRRCYYYPVHGALLAFKEIPRPSKHWVFRAWIVRNGGKTLHIHARTFRLRVRGALHYGRIWYRARVKANYVYP